MKYIPVLMSTPMVIATLEGRKTKTRRIVKINGPDEVVSIKPYWSITENFTEKFIVEWECMDTAIIKCPYGQPGDVLWVRETWRAIEQDFGKPRYEYKATEKINLTDKWKPSIFMPKDACRIFLKVTAVKAERLQDISEQDAIAEGVMPADCCVAYYHGFSLLWVKINGQASWDANPWVWVISFERIEKPQSNKIEVAWEENQK